jgi:hypothetical protein
METWRVSGPVVADSHPVDVEQDPDSDPHRKEKMDPDPDPDPHLSEKLDPEKIYELIFTCLVNVRNTKQIMNI